MSNISNELLNKIKYEQLLTQYTESLRQRAKFDMTQKFADFRKFPIETVQKCGIFHIGEMTEMLLPSFLDNITELGIISPTNNKPIFNNRWVIPIYNTNGLVQNLVGYSPDANERYIYGTSKYYRRKDTLWGLENLGIAYEMGYAILTEGITDSIRLRGMGYPNTFARCGTHKSQYMDAQLNRCRYGVIAIPDRDDAGIRALSGWNLNRQVTVSINYKYKDVDEMCRESDENKDWFNSYMIDCINWIKSVEHKGNKCICESITIL